MTRFDRRLALNGTLAVFLECVMITGCSSGSNVTGGTPTSNSGMTKKSGAASDQESDEADLPGEISGAFLTCSFVSTEETGFPQTDDQHSVGCSLRDNGGEKVDLSHFETSLTELDASQKELPTQTRMAESDSPWHLFAQIPLDTPRDHKLAFTVRQARTEQKIKTYQFEVIGLYGATLSSNTVVEVVGKMLVGGTWNRSASFNLAEVNPFGTMEQTPILPSAFCEGGVVREQQDTSCMSKLGNTLNTLVQDIGLVNKAVDKKRKTTKKSAACFVTINEAKCGTTFAFEVVKSAPVLEGGGCLMILSPDGLVIYGRSQIDTYHMNTGLLEQYVKAKPCSG